MREGLAMQAKMRLALCFAALLWLSAAPRAEAHDSPTLKDRTLYFYDHVNEVYHLHYLRAYSQLASPVHEGTYTTTYNGGDMPFSSGINHKVDASADANEWITISWMAGVGDHLEPYESF